MTALICFLLTVYVVLAFVLIRNNRVLSVRIAFIDCRSDWEPRYRCLPSYDAMLLHPRFWLLWTFADWTAWVDRKQSEVTQ